MRTTSVDLFGWSHFNRGDQSPWNATRDKADRAATGPDIDAYEDADDQDAQDAAEAHDGAGDRGEPVAADADFEKLASDLGAQPDVAPVF